MTEIEATYNATVGYDASDDRRDRCCSEGHRLGYTRKVKNVTHLYVEWQGLTICVDGGARFYCPECKAAGVKTLFTWHIGQDFIESLERRRKNPGG